MLPIKTKDASVLNAIPFTFSDTYGIKNSILQKKADSRALARAFYAVATELGFEAACVYGDNIEYNIVKVNDKWYACNLFEPLWPRTFESVFIPLSSSFKYTWPIFEEPKYTDKGTNKWSGFFPDAKCK